MPELIGKMSKQHFVLKKEVCPGAQLGDLLGFGAHQLIQMHVSVPPRKSVKLADSGKKGSNREDPRNKWFWQLLGTSPQISLSGPASPQQRVPRSLQGELSWLQLYSGNPGEPDVMRAQQPHVGWQKTVTESGARLLASLKPIKRQGWWKGKFVLFWRLATMGFLSDC